MTDQPAFNRRASYGPSSPTVGTRGAKTRQDILDAALATFRDTGFYACSVDDIAIGAGISRAALYQYFESKEAIFRELMNHSGGALMRAVRKLGPLGPNEQGLTSLLQWSTAWAEAYERFSALFIEWANVNSPGGSMRPELVFFNDLHTEAFSAALRNAGIPADEAPTAALVALAVTTRYNYIRHVYRPGLTDSQFVASLAIGLQLYFFPDTPLAALAAVPVTSEGAGPERETTLPPMSESGPFASLEAAPDDGAEPKRISSQAALTRQHLLDSAGRVFAANGYDASNIDQIVAEAVLARGTFYRYFANKLELMIALADQASNVMAPLFAEFATATTSDADLTEWLETFLVAQRRYTGVLRAWTEGYPIEAAVLAPAALTTAAISDAVVATFGPRRPYPLYRRAAGMMFTGLLEHFPTEGLDTRFEPTPAQIVAAQATFIRRVVLPISR